MKKNEYNFNIIFVERTEPWNLPLIASVIAKKIKEAESDGKKQKVR